MDGGGIRSSDFVRQLNSGDENKMKTLAESTDFVAAKEKLSALETDLNALTIEREKVASQLRATRSDPRTQALQLLNGDNYAADAQALGQQLAEFDSSIDVHAKAIEVQRALVEDARSVASESICAAALPQFVGPIKIILQSLRSICDANQTLEQLRDNLEREGVRTGSIPVCILGQMGSWDNERRAGIVLAYKNWINAHFPEVKF
jgi:hypothetical protein